MVFKRNVVYFKDLIQKWNQIRRCMTLVMTLLMKKGMCFIKYYVEDDKY